MVEKSDLSSVVPESSKLHYLQFASILLNGLEKLAEIQKSALSTFAELTKDSADSIKPLFPIAPVPLLEMAEWAIREFLQIQVRLLDLMLSQRAARVEALKSRACMDYELEVAGLMYDSTDSLVAMQRKAVELIIQQNQMLAAAIAEQAGNGNAADKDGDDPMQPDTAVIIQAQKQFWDVTLKSFKMLKAEFPPPATH